MILFFLEEEAKVEAQPEAKPVEEKKEEKTEEKKEEKKEEINVQVPTILWVDLHCVGCAKKVERSIRNFRGVEEVELDMNENQVRVKGIVDPQALCLRIQRKTKRRVRLLSPLPKPEENNSAPEVITSKVSRMTTVELNVNMHCEACSQQLKKKILKMRGVQTVETDLESGKVTVIGTMNAERLVEYLPR
ncbi:hypothetical protein AMTR_s00018p00066090 [Amborella trichopoda]|uniref:HMA domain-containing protein n=1 Tax=Amborella trichopoda TaxID=13333 RepID=W1PLT6_AMBTC|nr:hypothetical protein AMTR_s00018p00066090 [Amborella trichopoda]